MLEKELKNNAFIFFFSSLVYKIVSDLFSHRTSQNPFFCIKIMKPILFPVWVCFIDGYVYGNGTISTATGVFTAIQSPDIKQNKNLTRLIDG